MRERVIELLVQLEKKGEIKFCYSKRSSFFIVLGSLMFVLGGKHIFFLESTYKYPSWELKLLGYLCILFFGLGAIIGLWFLIFNGSPFRVKEEGVLLGMSFFKENIFWCDIEDFRLLKVNEQEFIVIYLKNPEKHINKQKNRITRKLMQINNNNYGSPYTISSKFSKVSKEELLSLLNYILSIKRNTIKNEKQDT